MKLITKYEHLFFDLDHTLWDFETNAKETLQDLYQIHSLKQKGIEDFTYFFERYNYHNERLWKRYTKGFIKQEELRWKRMWLTLIDFKIADETLSKTLSSDFLQVLPTKTHLFPYTKELLEYLQNKGFALHLITNGFEQVQQHKLINSNIHTFFKEIITSERANSLKPNKEIFEFALSATNATFEKSIMIGDNLEADIKGASNVGWDTVFVNHLKTITSIKATYEVTNLKQLESIFI